MIELNKVVRCLFVIVVFQGCSTPYYGHSKEDWEKLSEEEHVAIKKEYQFIVDSRKEQTHKNTINAKTQSVIDLGIAGPKY